MIFKFKVILGQLNIFLIVKKILNTMTKCIHTQKRPHLRILFGETCFFPTYDKVNFLSWYFHRTCNCLHICKDKYGICLNQLKYRWPWQRSRHIEQSELRSPKLWNWLVLNVTPTSLSSRMSISIMSCMGIALLVTYLLFNLY